MGAIPPAERVVRYVLGAAAAGVAVLAVGSYSGRVPTAPNPPDEEGAVEPSSRAVGRATPVAGMRPCARQPASTAQSVPGWPTLPMKLA